MGTKIGRVEVEGRHGRTRSVPLVRCSCGAEVVCDAFTNTCDACGADYGPSGTRLAPRSDWGEETGESACDVLVSDEALVASLDDPDRW